MHTFSDDRGRSFMSIFDHLEFKGQFNSSVMYSGAVKAWHRHFRQDDHWVVMSGNLKIGLYNSTSGPLVAKLMLATTIPSQEREIQLTIEQDSGKAVFLGEHQPGILRIPAGLWHGGVAVGGDALLLYYVTRKYDPTNPDEERTAWDSFDDFKWGVEHH